MGKSGDTEGDTTINTTLSKPTNPKMQAAKVHMPNGTSKDFELHRGSDGDVLFTLVSTELSIEERDYFSLCFYDNDETRHWLYNDKKILRQLKGLSWEFSFEVKFYPTEPATLNDDNARYNLFLQLRKDVASGRLPATIPTHALLGALVAQAEYGDSDSTAEYERYLRDSLKVPNLNDQTQLMQLLDRVKEVHREQKGLTASEAESKYLDACKQLSMYGVFVFDAKDKDDSNVGIGICATGVNIYKETIRVHRFVWQNIVKISYRKNSFSVKIKEGELNKKEVTLTYKVHDYVYAKRVWKCGVEHHTFFRLIQPENKPKKSLFRWGSTRFHYHGRTQFQTKMASQMFDHPQGGTVPRSTSARLTQSFDHGLNKENIPVHDKSATLGRDGQPSSPVTSPGVSYEIASSKRAGSTNGKVGATLDEDELVYTPVESPTSAAYYLSARSSLRSPYSSGAVSPDDWSAWGRDVSWRQNVSSSARRNLFGRGSGYSEFNIVRFDDEQLPTVPTARYVELEQLPIQQSVTMYHRGFYTERPEEPTVRMQHYAPRNGHHAVERLEPVREMQPHPIHYFVNLHHSGICDRIRINRLLHSGVEDTVSPQLDNYAFPALECRENIVLCREQELVPAFLLQYSNVYYAGEYPSPRPQPTYRLIAKVGNTETPSPHESLNVTPESQTMSRAAKRKAAELGHKSEATTMESKIEKTVVLSKSAGEPEEEKPEVRLLARIAPSQEPEDPAEKVRESTSSLFGFLKTSGKKSKSVSNESSTIVTYPSTSDRYEGPLDTVDRRDDLANLPLEHQPRVPYVSKTTVTKITIAPEPEEEIRQFRYIARVRHEGEEETVEKDQVKPELYGLPSTSYEGPLEETNRHDDLQQLPLSEHAQDYHSGQSWIKVKPSSPVKEHEIKKKAVLHLKSAGEPEEEKPEVRLLARIAPSQEPEDPAEKVRESTSSLFGFLKTSGKKSKSVSNESSTIVTYPSTSDRYEGPLDTVDRRDDLANLPLEHQPRVPYVSKTTVTKITIAPEPEEEIRQFRYIARVRHEGEEETVEKDQVKPELYGLPSTSYEGPLEETNRHDDLQQLPLSEHAQDYHSGQSWIKVKPSSPVKEHEIKKKAVLHLKSAGEPEEEKPEVRLLARIAPSQEPEDPAEKARESTSSLFGFLKTSGKKSKSVSNESSTIVTYPSTSDRYEGPLDTVDRRDDLANLPLEHQPRVPYVSKTTVTKITTAPEPEEGIRQFRYIARVRHEGEEETVEKDQVKPELYGLPSTSYEGPLEETNRHDDLQQLPLSEHAQDYHSGQSWIKVKPSSPVKEHEIKKKAVLHLKSAGEPEEEKPEVRLLARIAPSQEPEDPAEKVRESTSSLFGFLKTSGKKSKSVSNESSTIVTYPSTSDRYEGPLDTVDRRDDLANLPLEHQPRVPYVSKTTVTKITTAPEPEEGIRQFRYIARVRHEGEEETVEKDQVKPELYGLPSTSYEGPLEETNRHDDLQQLPLSEHAQDYHSGQSWIKVKPSSPVKEHEIKKKAVLHLKSAGEPEEEKPEVRLLARIAPSQEPEDPAEKARESTSSLFGFLKTSGKKSKSVSNESSTIVTYPSTSDRYEGPLDTVDRRDDLANLPLEHQPRVPYVSKTTVTKITTAPEPEEGIRQFRYIARVRHEGEEETVEKDQVKPELYGLPSTSYEGPLEETNRHDDLQQLPLSEHAQDYHSGQSWIKVKPSSPVKEHEIKKKAVLHLKSAGEPEEEKPEVRLLARIAPSQEPEDPAEKARESTSSLFGFLKTSGKKSKSVSNESSTIVTYPSTSDRYEGPLDTVDRRDDLANLPLEHQPRVPYVSKTTVTKITTAPEPEEGIRQFRYIARVRHEGEEETVEKDQVKPELYGLPSTSYEGPLEETNRHDDLQQLPLSEHAQDYHSGQSWIKVKPSSPVKEHEIKKKAVLHLKSAGEPEEEKPEVRLLARIAPSQEPEDPAEKARESTSSLFGFLKTSGKKSKSVSNESSTIVTYPSTSDRYEGPLDTVDRRDDLANLPLEHQPRVPYVSKTTVTKITTAPEPEEGIRQFRYIARVRHEGEEETVEKDQVKPELYGLPSTSYEGPLEETNRHDDLQQLPLSEHAQDYHSGQSWIKVKPSSPVKEHEIKKKAVLHLKSAGEPEEEKPEVRLLARIAPSQKPEDPAEKARESTSSLFGFLKTSGKKSKSVSNESSTIVTYPSTSDRYEGPLDTVDRRDDLANLPLEHQPRVPYVSKTTVTKITTAPEPEEGIRQFRYIARVRHEGEEETVEKDQVKPELYGLPSTSYEGPLEETNRHDDLQQLPLSEHAQDYHSGQSWIKVKPSSPVKEHEIKKKAVLHLKSAGEPEEEKPEVRLLARIAPSQKPEDPAEKVRESTSSLFGFLKTSGKKSKSVSNESSTIVTYPSTSDRYEGPLDTVDRRDDLANLPLEHQPRVPYVSKTTVTKITIAPEPEEEIRQFRYIARVRHEGEEETVEKDQVKPELYGLPSTSYEGPLEETNRHDDLQQLPLSEHAQDYHSGQSWIKVKPSSPVKEHEIKKKAVLHLKSAGEPEEEKPEVRLLARIAPSQKPEDPAEKARESTSSLFGFLKTSGKKSKSVSNESSTIVTYPSTSDRYEGPLDTVDRRDDLANLPLEHQPRVPYVSKTTVTKITTAPEPEEGIRQFRYIARVRHEGEEETVEKDQVKPELYGLPSTSYEGPLEETNRHDDLQQLPLSEHAQDYHSGQSWIKVKPSSPVKEHEIKKKAVLHLKSAGEPEEEKPEVRLLARIAPSQKPEDPAEKVRESTSSLFGFLKTSGKKSKSVSNESSTIVTYPSTSDRYEGPLDTVDRRDDLANLPLEHQPRVPYVSKTTVTKITIAPEPEEEIRQFRYIARVRHEGEEETVEKDQVKPELYGLPSTSYEGPLEETNRHDDLQQLPLSEHAQDYHSGQSWIKVKPSSPVKEHEIKKKAVLHLKSAGEPEEEKPEVRLLARIAPSQKPEDPAEKARESTSSLFGFLKTSGKKSKSVSNESSTIVTYPSTSDRYEGPLDTVDRRDDLANLPLEHQPRVPYVSKTTVTKITTAPEPEEGIRQFRYIARVRHEGEEETVEKDQVKPELYGLPSTSYEGPLEETNRHDDLQQLPLSEHAQDYHSGQSWIKVKPSSPVKEHEIKKKAVLHLKSAGEPEEEKPEVRLLARIAPSQKPEDPAEKVRESTSSLFGFLKTSGKKSKSVSNESSTIVTYPSTSDRYEGPLDTVDRRDDLANLPLEHQPRVPYVSKTTVTKITIAPEPEEEIRQFRYIARVRHEGEEETVEKDQVKPELYGLPSTSYEGPLEETNRHDDLQQLPLSEHAQDYHSGQSWIKVKPSSPVKEHEIKKKAVLHLKSAGEPEEEKPEVRLLARIAPSQEPEDPAEKARESTSSLFGFLKTSGKKSKSVSNESSTIVTYPSTSDRYEGPLDTVDRRDDLANLPLEHQPRVPYVSKTTVTKITTAPEPEEGIRQFRYIARVRHEGEEETVEKDQVKPELYGLPSTSYEGPLEETNRHDDLQQLPLSEHAQDYHSGQSWIKVKPSSPVKEHEIKKKAVLHLKSAGEPEEEKPEVRLLARIAPSQKPEDPAEKVRESTSSLFGFLKTSGKKSKSVSNESSTIVTYPSTSDRYEGPLDTVDRRDDLANLPLEHQPRVPYVSKTTVTKITIAPEPEEEIRQFRYIARVRHEGEEETVEKDQVKPELYGLPSTSYEGPLEETNRHDDLQQLPLSEHAQDYHSGQSWIKVKPSSPVKEHEIKKKAVLHLKSAGEPEEEKPEVRLLARIAPSQEPEDPAEKVRESTSSLFGFLKTSGKKSKSVSNESSTIVTYPSTSDRYEGPLDTVDRRDDLANLPLEHQPRVPYVSKTTVTKITTAPEPEEGIRQFRYIARVRHEGEEETVEKDQVKPELYGLPSTSYEGPLEETNRHDDLQQLPLSEHAQDYHSGQSWIKVKPSSPVKEHEIKKKAVLHLKSAGEPEEEKPEVRLLARIAPSQEPEDPAEKVRESTSSLFGFLKTSGKKSKSVSNESSTIVTYPSTSDRYEGPLDTVDRRDDLANLPLEHQPRVPYVSKTTVTKITTAPEPEEEIRQFRYIARVRHEGEEETVEKDQVKPELYGLPSTSYEGPLEETNRHDDLQQLPLSEHAQYYHSGQSWIKMKPSSPVKEHEIKKKAVLHLKSAGEPEEEKPEVRLLARIAPSQEPEDPAEKARESTSSLFGFLKRRKHRSLSTADHAHFSSSTAFHTEGVTADGQQWIEVRVERRVEVQLEPVFCLTGAGLGAVSQDEAGLIFTSTSTNYSNMAPAGRSFLSRLGFKGKKKSKKTKGEHETDSSDSSSSDEETRVIMHETAPDDERNGGNLEHKLVRHETKEQSYRLSGLGKTSGFNPEQPSLSTTIAEAERLNQRSPRLEHAERTITVRALAPLPVSFEESGQPHTTVATWQETTVLPDNVTVEYDERGNRIKRTVKTSQVKHTVQKQTFQNYTVPDETDPSSTVERTCEQLTPLGLSTHTGPIVDTQTRSVVYEANTPSQGGPESLGEFVSSKTVTSGNRTIETITYKTERDGIVETHVEHRVTIHSEVPIDHDAELSAAIAEATQLNPEFSVERIEVRQETST